MATAYNTKEQRPAKTFNFKLSSYVNLHYSFYFLLFVGAQWSLLCAKYFAGILFYGNLNHTFFHIKLLIFAVVALIKRLNEKKIIKKLQRETNLCFTLLYLPFLLIIYFLCRYLIKIFKHTNFKTDEKNSKKQAKEKTIKKNVFNFPVFVW